MSGCTTTINGQRQYLWRAVDQHRNVLDILVTSKRDAKATAMRNIAISLLRLAGWTNIKQATEKMSRRLDQVLTLLGV